MYKMFVRKFGFDRQRQPQNWIAGFILVKRASCLQRRELALFNWKSREANIFTGCYQILREQINGQWN